MEDQTTTTTTTEFDNVAVGESADGQPINAAGQVVAPMEGESSGDSESNPDSAPEGESAPDPKTTTTTTTTVTETAGMDADPEENIRNAREEGYRNGLKEQAENPESVSQDDTVQAASKARTRK